MAISKLSVRLRRSVVGSKYLLSSISTGAQNLFLLCRFVVALGWEYHWRPASFRTIQRNERWNSFTIVGYHLLAIHIAIVRSALGGNHRTFERSISPHRLVSVHVVATLTSSPCPCPSLSWSHPLGSPRLAPGTLRSSSSVPMTA